MHLWYAQIRASKVRLYNFWYLGYSRALKNIFGLQFENFVFDLIGLRALITNIILLLKFKEIILEDTRAFPIQIFIGRSLRYPTAKNLWSRISKLRPKKKSQKSVPINAQVLFGFDFVKWKIVKPAQLLLYEVKRHIRRNKNWLK